MDFKLLLIIIGNKLKRSHFVINYNNKDGNLISRVGSTFLILLVSNKIEESKISLWGMMREDL